MTSLLMTDCSKFLLRLPGKLGRQSYRAVSMVQSVLRSKLNAVVVDQGFEQRAGERQPYKPAQVHGRTGMLSRVRTILALGYWVLGNIW